MHEDHRKYFKFTKRAQLEKSVNSLIGIVEGITIDKEINEREVQFLRDWLDEHLDLKNSHPYNELIPAINSSLEDGVLTAAESEDIKWLCRKLVSIDYFDQITSDLQRLHALLGAILADNIITEKELRGLSDWIGNHEHLKTCWPYDEVDSIIVSVMSDKKIDINEQDVLKDLFSEFIGFLDNKTIVSPVIVKDQLITGLCSVCPEIKFEGSKFCFTGASSKFKREEIMKTVTELGGIVSADVSSKVDYLIVGAEGNPCWAYACYGRKVEKAVKLRKDGNRIQIVHEHDLHDAISDIQ